MQMGDILVLRGNEVSSILSGQEKELVHYVRDAYVAHARGTSSLPHSTFLHFPKDSRSRIIALPAYLGDNFETAGIKWISSFPANIEQGLDRASAVVILNSTQTGIPEAIIEGSVISTKRTAASASLAAQYLQQEHTASQVGIIGCGLINFEIVRFLLVLYPEIEMLVLFDIDISRALQFKDKCLELSNALEVRATRDSNEVFRSCPLVSLATTAGSPHIFDLSECPPNSVILHISLRDLSPEVILRCDNIVDDADHVSRAQTSVHLAEQLVGNRDHIRCTLAEVLLEKALARKSANIPTVFSPFGLGILDLAVSKFVYDLALKEQRGTVIPSFLPTPWLQRVESHEAYSEVSGTGEQGR